MNQFIRSELLLTKSNIEKLKNSKVAIFGLGGVGSYVVEGLSRCCVGNFVLIDNDVVEESNINRQIIATYKTIGKNKVDVAKDRILDINPEANVTTHKVFYNKDVKIDIIKGCDYVIDAIDTVSSKLYLITVCKENNIPIISCMGTGNKLDPTKFVITDIYKTKVCPLCREIRKELKKRNIKLLKVLYSEEQPIKPENLSENYDTKKQIVASVSFVPSVGGLIISSEVIKDLIN